MRISGTRQIKTAPPIDLKFCIIHYKGNVIRYDARANVFFFVTENDYVDVAEKKNSFTTTLFQQLKFLALPLQ
jgi:hypothetical protein